MSGTRTFRRSLRASAPNFTHKLSFRDENEVRILECHVDGCPKPDIRWEKSGRPIGKSRRVHMVRSGEMCLLQIRLPQEEDSGLYTCTASNSVGTVSTHIKIASVTSKPPIKKANGTVPHTLSPIKAIGLRSSSMDRSRESIDGNKNLQKCSTAPRSRSTSRSRQDNANNSKSKISSLTNSIWRRNDAQNSSKPPVVNKVSTSRNKEPSKSIDRSMAPSNSNTLPAIRSRSASRTQHDVSSNATKSKLSNFTGNIWKRNDSQSAEKLTIISSDMKELSRSMEDCRKPKRSLFNKVKIPEIFVMQKQISIPCDRKKNAENISLVTENDIHDKNCNNLNRVNGNGVLHGTFKSNTLKNVHVPKDKSNEQSKPKGKIAMYLKRFESGETPVKPKELPKERSASLTLNKNARNKERKSSEHADSESFFRLGRFMRRKSSGSGKKNHLEITDGSTFVSHVSCDSKDSSETATDDVMKDNDQIERSLCDINDSNGVSNAMELNDSSGLVGCLPSSKIKRTVDVIPDITGFCLISDSDGEIEETVNSCAKRQIPLNHEEEISKECDTVSKDDLHNERQAEILDKTGAQNEEHLTVSSEEDRQIPSIQVDETWVRSSELQNPAEIRQPMGSQKFQVQFAQPNSYFAGNTFDKVLETTYEIPEKEIDLSPAEERAASEIEAILTNDSLSRIKPCKGRIRYSSNVIEEECQYLQETNTPAESLESDLQRVSSPIESPARIVKGPQSVTVLRGESITLAICFTGHPTPNVLWMKGGRVLQNSEDESGVGRLTILEGREMSVVTVNDVTADDSGKYVVCVENDGGGDSRFASVAVVGFPEPPGGEPTESEVTDHSLTLSWYGSMYDGGSVVTGYQVEMCTLPDKKWHKVTSSVNTSCSVQGLSMGQRYVYRVRAENRYGVSHPSKESKIICLNDFLQYDTSSDEEPEDELENPVTIENGSLFTERFDLKEEVGKGRFGTVYRCVELSCGRPRAAKVIRCLKMKDKEKVRQEIEIMSRLHHPKLMQVLAAFESGRNMIMVMEFISGGELFERVIADDFVLTEQDCVLFMKQICDGVAYMHRNDILHLDLKPENILCKTRTSHKIKIIDFGLARLYKSDESLRILFGTPEFVAPEVISYEPVSPASDMWSVGVICYVLLSGLSPFMGDNDTETFSNITRGEMDFDDEAFDEISQDAKDFISGLLIKKTKGRMRAEDCLKHPWLATARLVQKRPLSTEKLKRFIIRRKWQKSGTAIRALGRMVSLSRSSLGSSVDSFSPLGSPTSSRSRSSLLSRSETAESGDSVFSR